MNKCQVSAQSAEHTPGPWIAHPFQLGEIGRWRVIQLGQAGGSAGLCVVHPRPDAKVAAANARLIASAPDLLAERDRLKAANAELARALQIAESAMYECPVMGEPLMSAITTARAALIKHQGSPAPHAAIQTSTENPP